MNEKNVSERICSYCSQSLPWIFSGKKLKDGSKIYVDHAGARWAGKRCPNCERSRVQAAIKFDPFERHNISSSLNKEGYTLLNGSNPYKVIDKEGRKLTVNICRAFNDENGNITVDGPVPESASEVNLIVFQTVKLCNAETFDKIKSSFNPLNIQASKKVAPHCYQEKENATTEPLKTTSSQLRRTSPFEAES